MSAVAGVPGAVSAPESDTSSV